MDQLGQKVARARRRLIFEQFLTRLAWSLLATLSLAAIAIAVPRLIAISTLPTNWDSGWFLGALVVGAIGAFVWTFIFRHSALDAAIEIDRRFDLRERIASSLSLSSEDQATEAGRAVVNDAIRAVSRIEVDEKFHVRLDRRAWWPLVPAAIVFGLVLFVDRRAESYINPVADADIEKQIKQSTESLRKKIEERTKQAREQGLMEAEGLFKKIEQGTRELTEKNHLDRTKTAVKLNDLAKQLEERRQQLGGKDALREQFQNMNHLGAGPADKAAQALKQGDWKKAFEEFHRLANELREGKLDEQQLANQLQQIIEKLQAAAQARDQAVADLQKQIEQQRQQGNLAKAGELQQKLDQLQQQQQQMDRLGQMAQQLAEAQQSLQQGDTQQAADAIAQLAEQLAELQNQTNELDMLDAALDQIEMAKDAMACADCQGDGCQACQGNLAGMRFGENADGQPGKGIGKGRGIGPRPNEENPTNLRNSQVRQKPGQGAAVFGGMVEGPNLKGEVAQQIQDEMATLSAEPADPLTSERLPNSRRQHAEQYFQLLRDGK